MRGTTYGLGFSANYRVKKGLGKAVVELRRDSCWDVDQGGEMERSNVRC